MNNNFQKGNLKRWNDDKGFGFINSDGGKRDIFIHISALKRMSRRPVAGDIITYQVDTDNDGKQRAVNAKIEGVTEVNLNYRRKYVKQKRANNWIFKSLSIALILGFIVYGKYMKNSNTQEKVATPISPYATEEQSAADYSCEGKVYCSEMTSCDEAKFYLRNCPDTKMDGDGDGIPCESQWCN